MLESLQLPTAFFELLRELRLPPLAFLEPLVEFAILRFELVQPPKDLEALLLGEDDRPLVLRREK